MKLIGKLNPLGFTTTLCIGILNFPTSKHQGVWIGSHTSSMLMLNTEPPRAVCSAPSCSHCAPRTALLQDNNRTPLWRVQTTSPLSAKQQTTMSVHILGGYHQSWRVVRREQPNAKHHQTKVLIVNITKKIQAWCCKMTTEWTFNLLTHLLFQL